MTTLTKPMWPQEVGHPLSGCEYCAPCTSRDIGDAVVIAMGEVNGLILAAKTDSQADDATQRQHDRDAGRAEQAPAIRRSEFWRPDSTR